MRQKNSEPPKIKPPNTPSSPSKSFPFLGVLGGLIIILLLFLLPFAPRPARAQSQCGVVESVAYPIDTDVFQLMQAFGAPNARHRGWFHTGEDWWGGRGMSAGQPVRAIATGRVTLASPLAWGRDGGVVIIEHTFADGSIFYSQYGHIREGDGVAFPRPYTCVAGGDIIGVIADARPAPHLHFEIRITNMDLPGPGYTEIDPFEDGYRRPGKMIANWQAWGSAAHLWHADLIDERGPLTPPIVLSDESLIYLDTGRVSRLTSDGRVLWRYNLEAQAVGLVAAGDDSAWIAYASGQMGRIDRDGNPGERWEAGVALASAPVPFGTLSLFQSGDGALLALDVTNRALAWRLADVPPIAAWATNGGIMALAVEGEEVLLVSSDGTLISRQTTDGRASLTTLADGTLLAYSGGGMFALDAPYANGEVAGSGGALVAAADGRRFIFDGGALSAFAADGSVAYQYAVPNVAGAANLALYGENLVIVTQLGDIAVIRAADGALCGSTRIFGDVTAGVWQRLGSDGTLRVALADQIIGLDWDELRGACE
jgi:hypothetical protein